MTGARSVVALALLISAIVVVHAARPDGKGITANLDALPYAVRDWHGTEATPLDAETKRELAADGYLTRTYAASTGVPVGLYIAFYGAQRPGVSVHSPLHCLPGTGWETQDVGVADVPAPAGVEQVRRLVVRKNLDRAVVLYWYAVHGRTIANELTSKLWLLHDSIRLHRSDAALVRLVIPVSGSVDAAEQRGIAFARDLLPYLSRLWS